MGQAKLRGTKEERIAQAIAKKAAEPVKVLKASNNAGRIRALDARTIIAALMMLDENAKPIPGNINGR